MNDTAGLKTLIRRLAALGLAMTAAACTSAKGNGDAPEAEAARLASPRSHPAAQETLHGVLLSDPYRWLEDQWSPDTREWIAGQNERTRAVLDSWPGRDQVRSRLEKLIRVERLGLPSPRGGRLFYMKRAADQEQYSIAMRDAEGRERILVDGSSLDPGNRKSAVMLDITSDGKFMAWGIREGGADELEVRIRDIDKGTDLADTLPTARYFGVSILPGAYGLIYARHGESGSRVYYHRMNSDPGSDEVIFGSDYGPGEIVAPELSDSGRLLLLTVYYGSAAKKTEVFLKDLATDSAIIPVVKDVEARFEPAFGGETIFIRTNLDAPNGRIMRADPSHPAMKDWTEIVPHEESVIESFALIGGMVVVERLENVQSRVTIHDMTGAEVGALETGGIGSVGGMRGEWDSPTAYYSFESFHVPPKISRWNIATGERSVWHESPVDFESGAFTTRQVRYRSKDGTEIPMFLVHREDLSPDGRTPVFLTGYGGFNISRTPGFSAGAAVWLMRGGIYALPSLRGGGEFGEAWHEAGMLERKQNVFDDFIAAAEWLVAEGYTRPERIAIAGRSNGGLLVGAAMTQRPELFGAVVCGYPLLDMIRYHRFLVARFWVPEYGSSEDPEQFRNLLSYSPYHNLKEETDYPAVMFVTGDSDTRVDPLHARKMAALMQDVTSRNPDARPVLLHYDTEAGHSGGTPASKSIDDLTDELTFMFRQLGVGE